MTNRDLIEPSSQDRQLGLSWRQALSQDQVQATPFEEIWHRAEVELESAHRGTQALDFFLNFRPARWSMTAAAFVVLSYLVMTQFNSQKVPDAIENPLLSATISTEEELFSALLASTQWSAPSDRFLKKVPQMQVWGLPTLDIRLPNSTEGS